MYSFVAAFQSNIILGRSLFRLLLSHPASAQTSNNGELVDLVHHPQIGLACSLLTDTNRQGPEVSRFVFSFSTPFHYSRVTGRRTEESYHYVLRHAFQRTP